MSPKTTLSQSIYVISSCILLLIACSVNAQNIQYNLSATTVFVSDTASPFNMTLNVYPTKGFISINFTGPTNKWFGVGFGSNSMENTYAIVCSLNNGTKSICQENQLGADNPSSGYGTKLEPTIKIEDDKINGNIRTIYMKRGITIGDSKGRYFNFSTWTSTINIIYCIGSSSTFTKESSMGPHVGPKRLTIANTLDNNLTVASTTLGSKIRLNSIVVYPDQDIVQFSVTGPDDVYFGIGFNGTSMGAQGAPVYAMISDNTSSIYEESFEGTGVTPNNALNSTIHTIVNNTASNGTRTVIFNRKRNITKADTADFAKHFEFPSVTTKNVPIIYAIGTTENWAYTNSMNTNDYTTAGSTNVDFDGPPEPYHLMARAQLPNVPGLMIDIIISPLSDMVNITIIGPSDRWFGVGFNSFMMEDAYAIVCSDEPLCFEQVLGNHTMGQRIPGQEIQILSDNTIGNIRNVSMSRKQTITSVDNVNYQFFYNFPSIPDIIPIIYAYGKTDTFNNASEMQDGGEWPLGFDYGTNRSNMSASMMLFPDHNQSVDIQVYPDTNQVDITFMGNATNWYGIGFNSSVMAGTYAIIVDSANTVNEYTLGNVSDPHAPGTKVASQTIDLTSDVIKDGIRTVKLTRPALTFDSAVYNFPFVAGDVNIISAMGLSQETIDYETSKGMADALAQPLTFEESGSGTFCTSGIEKYGVTSDVGQGFTIGLWIYCQKKTIQLTVDYTNYKPNWFGIVFNEETKGCQMSPHSNTTVWTTGKNNDKTLGLYAYDLTGTSLGGVNYYPKGDWRQNNELDYGGSMSIDYEQDLSNTTWTTSTSTIKFCVAWGSSGTELTTDGHNGASNTFGPVTYNLAAGTVSTSSSDDGYKKAHGIIMFIGWSVLTSIGIFSSRFRAILYKNAKNKAMWFLVHRGVQVFVVVLVLIAFGIAIYFTQDTGSKHFQNTHEIIGLVVVILGFLQPINAWFRPHPPKKGNPKSVGRLSWEIIHKSFGYITWIMAQIAIYLGIQQFTSDTTYLDIFIAWASTVFFIYILLWIYQTFCYIEPTKSSGNNSNAQKKEGLLTNEQNVASPNSSLFGASERSDS